MKSWPFVLEIPGAPIPKARARTVITNHGRRRTYTPERTVKAEEAIALAARAKHVTFHEDEVELEMVFSAKRWRGDIDNLEKLVMDALQKAGVYANDKQVTLKTSEIVFGAEEFTIVKARARDS